MGKQFYKQVEEVIREGVTYGYRRAFKHTDNPSEEAIIDQICDSVMIELEEVIDYELLDRAVTVLEEIVGKRNKSLNMEVEGEGE